MRSDIMESLYFSKHKCNSSFSNVPQNAIISHSNLLILSGKKLEYVYFVICSFFPSNGCKIFTVLEIFNKLKIIRTFIKRILLFEGKTVIVTAMPFTELRARIKVILKASYENKNLNSEGSKLKRISALDKREYISHKTIFSRAFFAIVYFFKKMQIPAPFNSIISSNCT